MFVDTWNWSIQLCVVKMAEMGWPCAIMLVIGLKLYLYCEQCEKVRIPIITTADETATNANVWKSHKQLWYIWMKFAFSRYICIAIFCMRQWLHTPPPPFGKWRRFQITIFGLNFLDIAVTVTVSPSSYSFYYPHRLIIMVKSTKHTTFYSFSSQRNNERIKC